MSIKNPRPGSELAKERKQAPIICAALSALPLLVLLCGFVFNTEFHDAVKTSGTHWLGLALLIVAMIVPWVAYLKAWEGRKGLWSWGLATGIGAILSYGLNNI